MFKPKVKVWRQKWGKKSWNWDGVCRIPYLQKPYLHPRIELGVELHVFGKPRESSFQNTLRIMILSFLEDVTPIWVTGARSRKICEEDLRVGAQHLRACTRRFALRDVTARLYSQILVVNPFQTLLRVGSARWALLARTRTLGRPQISSSIKSDFWRANLTFQPQLMP